MPNKQNDMRCKTIRDIDRRRLLQVPTTTRWLEAGSAVAGQDATSTVDKHGSMGSMVNMQTPRNNDKEL
jgi:hypothetical protein